MLSHERSSPLACRLASFPYLPGWQWTIKRRRVVFRGNISSLWSPKLETVGKLWKLLSSLGQTLGPDSPISPADSHSERHLVLRWAEEAWNSFTWLVLVEHNQVPGTTLPAGDTAGSKCAPKADAMAPSFLWLVQGHARARPLALWAPWCWALHKVSSILIIKVSAPWCCADERGWSRVDNKHAIT